MASLLVVVRLLSEWHLILKRIEQDAFLVSLLRGSCPIFVGSRSSRSIGEPFCVGKHPSLMPFDGSFVQRVPHGFTLSGCDEQADIRIAFGSRAVLDVLAIAKPFGFLPFAPFILSLPLIEAMAAFKLRAIVSFREMASLCVPRIRICGGYVGVIPIEVCFCLKLLLLDEDHLLRVLD